MKTFAAIFSIFLSLELFVYWMCGHNFDRNPTTGKQIAGMIFIAIVFSFVGQVLLYAFEDE